MVVVCMATVLVLMVEWHIGGCGLHGYSLVSNGRVAYRWLWSALAEVPPPHICPGLTLVSLFLLSAGDLSNSLKYSSRATVNSTHMPYDPPTAL